MSDLVLSMAEDEDPVLVDTPNTLRVSVGNGDPDEEIIFSAYDGVGVWAAIDEETLDEYGSIEMSVEIPALLAGTYTLRVAGDTSTDEFEFTVTRDPMDETSDVDANDHPEPPTFDLETTAWQLVDTTPGGESYILPRNPDRWTNPLKPNRLEHDVTTAPDGAILAWQGGDRPWPFEFSGYIDTKAEYDALEFWANLRRRFWLVDHRHRLHYVTFEHFDATARIVPNKPWAHDYTMKAVHFYRQNWDGGED